MKKDSVQQTNLTTKIIEFCITAPKTRFRTAIDFAAKTAFMYFCYSNPFLMGALCVIQILQAAAQLLISFPSAQPETQNLDEENVKYHQIIQIIKICALMIIGIMYADTLILLPGIIYAVVNLMTDGMSLLVPQKTFTDLVTEQQNATINIAQ